MAVLEFFDTRARRLGIVDTKLSQGAAMFLALAIAKLVPEIMQVSAWWFLGLSLACAIRPLVVFYGGGSKR